MTGGIVQRIEEVKRAAARHRLQEPLQPLQDASQGAEDKPEGTPKSISKPTRKATTEQKP